jgi:hypothetical protein
MIGSEQVRGATERFTAGGVQLRGAPTGDGPAQFRGRSRPGAPLPMVQPRALERRPRRVRTPRPRVRHLPVRRPTHRRTTKSAKRSHRSNFKTLNVLTAAACEQMLVESHGRHEKRSRRGHQGTRTDCSENSASVAAGRASSPVTIHWLLHCRANSIQSVF